MQMFFGSRLRATKYSQALFAISFLQRNSFEISDVFKIQLKETKSHVTEKQQLSINKHLKHTFLQAATDDRR